MSSNEATVLSACTTICRYPLPSINSSARLQSTITCKFLPPTSHLPFNCQPTTPHTSPVPPSRSPRTPPHQSSLSQTGATHILGLCLKLTPSVSPAPNPHMQHSLLSHYIPPRSLSLPSLLARSRACLFCIEAFAYIIIQYIGLLFRVFRSFII